MITLEQSVEDLIDLVCEVFGRSAQEGVRQRAAHLLVKDHGRRLAREGKHPVTGETRGEYEQRIRASLGKHPVTGELLSEFAETDWGA